MQRYGVFGVGGCGLNEAVGNFRFCLAQNDSRLSLAFRLGLPRHGVFETLRNSHVSDLHRLNRYSPGICLLVENALEFASQRLAFGDHLRQFMTTNGLPERGLGTQIDRIEKILHFEDRLFPVPPQAEDDGVDINWDRIASQGGFGGHAGHTNTLVHEGAERLHDGKNVKYSWPAKTDVTAQSEESDLLPLPYHFDGEQQVKA